MTLITIAVGELAANCYLFYDQESLDCAIIDPGDSGDFISEQILRQKLKPQFIMLTHGHFDHCLASLELQLNFNIPIFLNPLDNFLYQNAAKSAGHFTSNTALKLPPSIPPDLTLTKKFFSLIPTPGHTPGSVCLYSPPFLFTGDTLFDDDIGRTDMSYSNRSDIQNSLLSLSKLPPDTIIYPGHGPTSALKQSLLLASTHTNFSTPFQKPL